MPDIDVIIIGAGAAGIAAARHLHHHGLRCRIIEAADRAGGRAWTDGTSLGAPFDRGCAWFHCADRNPLVPLADAHGITYSGSASNAYHIDGAFLDTDAGRKLRHTIGADIEYLCAAGRAGQDVAAATLLDVAVAHRPTRDYLLAAINGVAASDYATAEAAADNDTGQNWIVHQGIGTLMQRLARGLDITTGCPARVVATTGDCVAVQTDRGTLRARAVVVTPSTGVLRNGDIAFRPELPDTKQDALARLPMGTAEKIALRFADSPFPHPPNTFLITHRTGEHDAFGFHLGPAGLPLAMGYAGGPQAEWLNTLPDETAAAFALDHLADAFGNAIRNKVVRHTRTRWAHDSFTQGSYSAAHPQGGHASRRVLAEPVGERLFFAGEATDPTDFATVHGAWQSGIRAAQEVLRQWGSEAGGGRIAQDD